MIEDRYDVVEEIKLDRLERLEADRIYWKIKDSFGSEVKVQEQPSRRIKEPSERSQRLYELVNNAGVSLNPLKHIDDKRTLLHRAGFTQLMIGKDAFESVFNIKPGRVGKMVESTYNSVVNYINQKQ